MKCPKCSSGNPDTNKFCRKCGEKLSLVCPHCGAEILPDDHFCGKCGQNLTLPSEPSAKALSPEEKVEKIQKYLPKGIAEKILAQRDRIEGERKQVTVMFCDMEGFTPFADKFGPEETYAVMDQVYEILIHKVHDYEGTVNEMTGDGIMALFGAPIALEDAPQRAIRSAYSIHREMARFNDKMKQEKEGLPPLKMRIGIHTGPVVVGTLGNDLRVEFKAVGDTVNLASRMESLAEPGTTFVTEDTFNLTEGFFRFENLGERSVKGKEEHVRVFRVIAPSTRRTRFEVSAEGGLTPFVGRERELEIMLDCLERSKMGRGQAISIVAEAGIGKSRLLYEFRKAIANEDVTFLEGRCLSYSRNVLFHPIIDLLKSNFDIKEEDTDDVIKEKVKKGLAILGAGEAVTLPYLLELLSVKDSGIDQIMMSPGARKERISGALKQIILKGAALRPLVLAIEDLYWVDNSSVEVFKDLLDDIGGAKIFLIFTYRPTFVHTWGAKSYHSQITLNRLSNRESLTMASNILETDNLQSDLEELILEKTEGVPLYVEEFIRTLKEIEIIEKRDHQYFIVKDIQEITVPSTIHDIIMARVDTLPEGAKEVLQAGSAIEREFAYEMIGKVTKLQEKELLSHLSVLKDAELIFERGIYPDTSFIFKHALPRDVVYNSLLAKRKKRIHEEIGTIIEASYNERIDEYHGVLVEHFISSENFQKGALYCRLAGRKAEKAGLLNDAISYGKKQVACLEKLPQKERADKDIINARTKLGLYYGQMGNFVDAKAYVNPIVDLAIKQNYKERISQIFSIEGCHKFWVEEDFSKGLNSLEKAIEIATELNHLPSLVLAYNWMSNALANNCEFDKALHYNERALEINVAVNVLWGISAIKSWAAISIYCSQGKIDLACKTSNEALQIADKSGDIYSMSHAYTAHGLSLYYRGHLEKAKEYLLKGADLAEKINLLTFEQWAHSALGYVFFDMGKYKVSEKHFERAMYLSQYSPSPSYVNAYKIALMMTQVMDNDKDIGINEIFKCHEDSKLKVVKALMVGCISEILLNLDDQHISEAEDWIKRSIEDHKKYGMMWHLAKDYTLYAEWHKRKRDLSKAKETLSKAIEIFKECGADGWVERYEKELALLSLNNQNHKKGE